MADKFSLQQALNQLKTEINKETGELTANKSKLTSLDAEKNKLDQDIRESLIERKKKEQEILVLVNTIEKSKKRISEIDREHKKVEDEIKSKTNDLTNKNNELKKTEEDLRNILNSKK